MVSTKFFELILSFYLIATVRSLSPSVHQQFDVLARGQENSNNEIAIDPEAEVLAESDPPTTDLSNLSNEEPAALSSDVPPTNNNLDTQSDPDVNSLDLQKNKLAASSDQHNPTVSNDSQDLALDNDGLPIIPQINIFKGSGEMDYGTNPIEQFIHQNWHTHELPKPECEARTIPWGGDKPLPMFAFCCGKVPLAKGPNNQNQKRRSGRRKDCYQWDGSERCTLDSIHCCYCKNDQKIGYECERVYPAVGLPNKSKRNIIPIGKRQDTTNDNPIAASSPGQVENKVTSPPPDNSLVAMDLGGGPSNEDQKRPGPKLKPWVCRIDFERAQGAIRTEPSKPDKDDWNDLPYEEYDPEDEKDDDYDDLQPRPGYRFP